MNHHDGKHSDVHNLQQVKTASHISSALMVLLLALGGGTLLTGCEDKGPAEKAGESIDEVIDDAGDAIEDAADDIEDETNGS